MQHYGNRPDVIDFNKKYNLNFNLGSAVKYLARAGKKQNETKQSDLKKAIDFITRELEVIEPETVKAKDGLEVGKWYHTHSGNGLLIWNGGNHASGFWDGCYRNNGWFFCNSFKVKPATDEEVKEALIKEAQKRYKVGDRLTCILVDRKEYSIGDKYTFTVEGSLWVNVHPYGEEYSICIFKNGKWASHV